MLISFYVIMWPVIVLADAFAPCMYSKPGSCSLIGLSMLRVHIGPGTGPLYVYMQFLRAKHAHSTLGQVQDPCMCMLSSQHVMRQQQAEPIALCTLSLAWPARLVSSSPTVTGLRQVLSFDRR